MKRYYGAMPEQIGEYKLDVKEMMFYLYLPISRLGSNEIQLEDRLRVFTPLINAVREDIGQKLMRHSYMYLTAKRLFVTPGNPGNRPGWHSDGFGTSDLNYIWYDCIPTVFNTTPFTNISQDHVKSLEQFEQQRQTWNDCIWKENALLKLDQYVIHNSPWNFTPQMRTFVKISVSKNRYNLIGNSINPINKDWKMYDREELRNDPYHFNGDAFEG